MNRIHALSIVIAVAASTARAAPAAAPAPADPPIPLSTGDTVQFDLSALPSRYEGGGKAACKGTVIRATGPEAAKCERTFRFEVPANGARMTYVFRATAGGRETRIDLPLTRQSKPVEFKAPSAGALQPPAPVTIPAEVADRAAATAAAAQCAGCRGEGFTLEKFEVIQPPVPVDGTPSIRLKVTTTQPPPAKP